MKTLALVAVLSLSAFAFQAPPGPPAPSANHQWLQQFVGEWTVKTEMSIMPGAAPMTMESTESVRSIGGLWIVAEGSASFGGQSFTSLMTLGYDGNKQAFVGSWVDTNQTTLWTYRGSLDEAKKTLTLEAEGPSHFDPSKTAKYRDALTLESKDHRVMTSKILGDDGQWTQYLKAEYRRKK
jgi:hypothetical protein